MKVLLLEHPRKVALERCNDIANTPLCSCLLSGYAASMLQREGHDVEIIEAHMEGLSYDEVLSRVDAARPDILAVHMVYRWERDSTLFYFLEKVKEDGSPFIVAFGFYPTIACGDILGSSQSVDAVIAGEPELAMVRLAASRLKAEEVSAIPGIICRDGADRFRMSDPEAVKDLDTMPFPLRTHASLRSSEINILGSRGCYGRCTFCYINSFFPRDAGWRRRSPENIVYEIDALIARTGSRSFYFVDPNFFGPGLPGQKRALRIAQLLKTRNIAFGLEGRVNDIHDETIGALVEAGLRHILIGLESGCDESLKRLNKMTTVAQNEEAIRILRKHGIEPNVGFIMFEPDSSLHDVRTNFEFLKRNRLLDRVSITANVLYHHQIILQGTRAYHLLKEKGRLVLAGDASYEGTTYFEDRGVAALAAIMRRVTNKLFSSLDDIWSGRLPEPARAGEVYTALNLLLKRVFEENLAALEAGDVAPEDEFESIVSKAERRIEETVKTLY